MITSISVDGFRSLTRFTMDLNPGLNILVGPNGAGKTNIILFFQFLSNMLRRPIAEAITLTGGAGAFFTKTGEKTFQRNMSCELQGAVTVEKDTSGLAYYDFSGTFIYTYEFKITATSEFDSVALAYQRVRLLRLDRLIKKADYRRRAKHDWHLTLTQTATDGGKAQITVEGMDGSNLTIPNYILSRPAKQREAIVLDKFLSDYIQLNSSPDQCLLGTAAGAIRELRAVESDLAGGDLLNIVPSEVKKPEDSSREPGINSDGSGLVATLFQLQRPESADSRRSYRLYRANMLGLRPIRGRAAKNIYRQIQSFTRLVNPAIQEFQVYNDPFDNILKLRFVLNGTEGHLILPFSSMSDGTVKWIALVTAVLTYRSVFAIEEPENFLHPRMQQEVVNIMREDAERRGNLSFVVMTTHSETLLDAARPNEIIVVHMQNGITYANRSRNQREVSKLIQDTGFGLGHLYLTGALDNA